MTDQEAVRKVQAQLNSMRPEELGAVVSQADNLRRHGQTGMERSVGSILYRQALAAFTYQEAVRCGEVQ